MFSHPSKLVYNVWILEGLLSIPSLHDLALVSCIVPCCIAFFTVQYINADFSFSLSVSLFAVVEMAMNSILNPDDIKKALEAFQGDFVMLSYVSCFHFSFSHSKIYFFRGCSIFSFSCAVDQMSLTIAITCHIFCSVSSMTQKWALQLHLKSSTRKVCFESLRFTCHCHESLVQFKKHSVIF